MPDMRLLLGPTVAESQDDSVLPLAARPEASCTAQRRSFFPGIMQLDPWSCWALLCSEPSLPGLPLRCPAFQFLPGSHGVARRSTPRRIPCSANPRARLLASADDGGVVVVAGDGRGKSVVVGRGNEAWAKEQWRSMQ
ncbi:hypothetical protein Drorol1_Dr00000285 [Drosera rotundifolia]